MKLNLLPEQNGRGCKGSIMGLLIVSLVIALPNLCNASEVTANEIQSKDSREGKILPIFQVVKFKNSFCTSSATSRNGTCYLRQECEQKGGTIGSECAEGFGVCCSFELTCGGTSSENATYIINTSPTESCSYTICPCSDAICRIRFDFETLTLADPFVGTAASTVTANIGSQIGDCKTDQFTISGERGGSPVICGENSGQHMIVDAQDKCHTVQINVNTATSATRSWTIHVSQYTCRDEYSGGPPGCLQYHTATTGVISSFNYDKSQSSVATTTTHLSNQDYSICIRRGMACTQICYLPVINSSSATNSFGLSLGSDNAAQSMTNTQCSTDYITIPGGTTIANSDSSTATDPDANRVCGRFWNPATGQTESVSVCTRIVPFVVGFRTDADEVATSTNNASTNEQRTTPGGIIGFHLSYTQTC